MFTAIVFAAFLAQFCEWGVVALFAVYVAGAGAVFSVRSLFKPLPHRFKNMCVTTF